ncbi:MAG: hypothetical protein H7X88_08495 [Gloeobacteraceae cyanobacterium ES-bin-316]|nr:hypothetical protein [Ferruginibacter sp.]
MVCVFALSIAPTIFLHDAFARHIDSIEKFTSNGQQQIDEDFFNCQCDQLVAESPFTEAAIFKLGSSLQIYSIPKAYQQFRVVSCTTIFHSLRGPPLA